MKAQTPLFVALVGQHWAVARVLLEAGADPNGSFKNLCSPLSIMCQRGLLEGVALLCEFGADTEDSLRLLQGLPGLPIVSTATYHHLQCLLFLLLIKARPDVKSPPLLTPLLHAIVKYRRVLMFLYNIISACQFKLCATQEVSCEKSTRYTFLVQLIDLIFENRFQ